MVEIPGADNDSYNFCRIFFKLKNQKVTRILPQRRIIKCLLAGWFTANVLNRWILSVQRLKFEKPDFRSDSWLSVITKLHHCSRNRTFYGTFFSYFFHTLILSQSLFLYLIRNSGYARNVVTIVEWRIRFGINNLLSYIVSCSFDDKFLPAQKCLHDDRSKITGKFSFCLRFNIQLILEFLQKLLTV